MFAQIWSRVASVHAAADVDAVSRSAAPWTAPGDVAVLPQARRAAALSVGRRQAGVVVFIVVSDGLSREHQVLQRAFW
jgi:hypothetical protein